MDYYDAWSAFDTVGSMRLCVKSFSGDAINVQRNSDLKKSRYASSSRNYIGVAKTPTRFS